MSTELQEISRGIHPAILSKGGLGPAIKTLARRSAVPVELDLNVDRRLSESIDLHRIDPADIKVPLTLVAVDQDALVPAADIEALANAIPHANFHLIHSRYGHDAFLKEEAQVARIITEFLESLEISR